MGFMTSPASDSMKEIIERLDQRIQTVDEERWLSSRYADDQARHALIVLYAFYYELARVRVVVTDQTMGQIRFQWWRDALRELEQGAPRQHDVVLALAPRVLERKVDPTELAEIIDHHEAAFLSEDRSAEPEGRLAVSATRILGDSADGIDAIAEEWAALRRGEAPARSQPKMRIRSTVRPAVAHFRLRHAWKKGRKLTALQKRLSVLCAMLTGRV